MVHYHWVGVVTGSHFITTVVIAGLWFSLLDVVRYLTYVDILIIERSSTVKKVDHKSLTG
jgi:hypothetical protein